jgi:hypothetical protein
MKTSIPRLSSVKFRNGTSLHVIRNTRAEECHRAYLRETAEIGRVRADKMIGFAVVAWCNDGSTSTALRVFDGSQVGRMGAPEFVKTALIDYNASED